MPHLIDALLAKNHHGDFDDEDSDDDASSRGGRRFGMMNSENNLALDSAANLVANCVACEEGSGVEILKAMCLPATFKTVPLRLNDVRRWPEDRAFFHWALSTSSTGSSPGTTSEEDGAENVTGGGSGDAPSNDSSGVDAPCKSARADPVDVFPTDLGVLRQRAVAAFGTKVKQFKHKYAEWINLVTGGKSRWCSVKERPKIFFEHVKAVWTDAEREEWAEFLGIEEGAEPVVVGEAGSEAVGEAESSLKA